MLVLLTACGGSGGSGVYGVVTHGEGEEPLEGAVVELNACDDSGCDTLTDSMTTGADGRYAFPEVSSGRYMLNILWKNSPDCPGIQGFNTLQTAGDFIVTYAGYGGLGGLSSVKNIFALNEFGFSEGKGAEFDINFICP
jgi:hypothetical protein